MPRPVLIVSQSDFLTQFTFLMTNSADPDQLASEEVNWSGSALFAKTGHVVFSKRKVNTVINELIHFTKCWCVKTSASKLCIYLFFWWHRWRYKRTLLTIASFFLGELVHVGTTCMDFRNPRLLPGRVLEIMAGGQAFHHGFCVGERGEKKLMAKWVPFPQVFWQRGLRKHCKPWSDTAEFDVWSESALFAIQLPIF